MPQNSTPLRFKFSLSSIDKLEPRSSRYQVSDSALPGFKLRISPDGNKSYSLVYRNKERKKTRYTIGNHGKFTPHTARAIARNKLAKLELGEDIQKEKKELRRISKIPTLLNFLEGEYSDWASTHTKSGGLTVKRIKSVLCEDFGHKRLTDISSRDLRKWRTKRLKKGLKPNTINRDIASFSGLLSIALSMGRIDVHPLRSDLTFKKLPVDNNAVVRYLSVDEEKRLRATLDSREEKIKAKRDSGNAWRKVRRYTKLDSLDKLYFVDHIKPSVLLSLNTGIRRGELFGLKWADVDLDNIKQITIVGERSKVLRTRHIPLNAEAHGALVKWKSQQTDVRGYVFCKRDGSPFSNIKTSWHTLLEEAEIYNFRWHDLRHSFASKLVMRGVDLNTVRELMGHSNIEMTLRYSHLAPSIKIDAVEKLVNSDV